MHLAARGGFAEIVRCLLLSGAEPDLPNKVLLNFDTSITMPQKFGNQVKVQIYFLHKDFKKFV